MTLQTSIARFVSDSLSAIAELLASQPRAQTRQNSPHNFIHPEPMVETLDRSMYRAAEDG